MGSCQSNQMQNTYVPILGKLGPVLDLKIVNCVWQKDYLGLYDYESKQINHYSYTVKSSSLLIYDKEHKIVKQIAEIHNQQELLKKAAFEVIKKSNYYKIQPIFIDNEQYILQKIIWLIVKSVPNHRYPLKERDIIKLGKQKIKIRQIVLNDSNNSGLIDINAFKTNKKIYDDLKYKENVQKSNGLVGNDLIQQIQSQATDNQQTCRICLQPGQFTNPLICACKCIGSVRYIHLQCLRTWLGKRLNASKSKFSMIIKWTPLTCEVCKSHYKYRIYLDNKKFYTVQIPKPGKPYIVLQVMKKSSEYSKIFHFVSLSQTSKVSMGRRKDIDIKISDDVSVSRHHANIIYDFQNRKFLLEDNKSKFGTVVLIKKNLLINPLQRGISFQMGGQIFIFDTQRGTGSINDYRDEVQYLNVLEKGENFFQNIDQGQSDENNQDDDFDDQQQEQDSNIPTNPSIPPSNHQAGHNLQNNQLHIIQNIPQINNPIPPSNLPQNDNEILDA